MILRVKDAEGNIQEIPAIKGDPGEISEQYAHNNFSNALKGRASGAVVRVDDVSPLEHNVNVNLTSDTVTDFSSVTLTARGRGKNFFNISKVKTSEGFEPYFGIKNNGDGTLMIKTPASSSSVTADVNDTLKDYAPDLQIGETYTLSAISVGATQAVYLLNATTGTGTTWWFNKSLTITETMLNSMVFWYATGVSATATISNIQIEYGTTATDYEPYIEPATYTANSDGTVSGVKSIYPSMTLMTDADVDIEVEYIQDSNKAMDGVKSDIEALDKAVSELASDTNIVKSMSLALPPTLYSFVGYPISIYFRNVMDYHPNDVYIRKYGIKGKQYADRWEYTPTTAETVYGSVCIYDHNYNKLNDHDIPIVVKDSTIKESLSVLVIGDSTVQAGKETQKMLDHATADGYNLTLLGTQGTAPNLHEGRGGWKAEHYVTKASVSDTENPFYNPTTETFDFAYYMAQQGYNGVDCVFLQLGINDVFSAWEYDIESAVSTYITNMETMVNSIHAYDANIKIVINLIIPCGVNQDVFTGYYPLNTVWRTKKNTYEANLALLDKFEGVSNVYLSPYNAAIDSANNLPSDVHPNQAGYEQLGTQMYSYMRAIN